MADANFASRREWELEVTSKLSEVLVGVRVISERLGKLDDVVTKHEYRFAKVEGSLVEHQVNCPLVPKVSRLEQSAAVKEARSAAASQESRRWYGFLGPFIYVLLAVLAGLALGHAEDILNLFSGRR